MTAGEGAGGRNRGSLTELPMPLLRWRQVLRGEERQLAVLRQWLISLLPECPARDDVVMVANELSSNAIRHTASGQGGCFALEVTWHTHAVLVAVADSGGPGEPCVVDDPLGEGGRGLLMVRGLSVRSGFTGDERGRLVWAQVRWEDPGPAVHPPALDPYQAVIRDGEAALARRFAGIPAWFGRSTLTWWALAGPVGLVSAPTARDLAGLLYRLANAPDAVQTAAIGAVQHGSTYEEAVPAARRRASGSGEAAGRRQPGTVGRELDPRAHGLAMPARRLRLVPDTAALPQP